MTVKHANGNGDNAQGPMLLGGRLLRRRQVEELTTLSRSSIYRLMEDGKFPRPVRVGTNAVRWRWSDITHWLEARPLART